MLLLSFRIFHDFQKLIIWGESWELWKLVDSIWTLTWNTVVALAAFGDSDSDHLNIHTHLHHPTSIYQSLPAFKWIQMWLSCHEEASSRLMLATGAGAASTSLFWAAFATTSASNLGTRVSLSMSLMGSEQVKPSPGVKPSKSFLNWMSLVMISSFHHISSGRKALLSAQRHGWWCSRRRWCGWWSCCLAKDCRCGAQNAFFSDQSRESVRKYIYYV